MPEFRISDPVEGTKWRSATPDDVGADPAGTAAAERAAHEAGWDHDDMLARIAALEGAGSGSVITGTYTGDGAASQAITGLGFKPKYLRIYQRKTTANSTTNPTITTDKIIDDHVDGMSIDCDSTFKTRTGIIISLDADGFTVGTTGTPNQSGVVYSYVAIG